MNYAMQTTSHGAGAAPRQRTNDDASTRSDVQLAEAKSLVRQERWCEGENAIRPYLEAHPDSADAHLLIAWVLFKESKPRESLHEYTVAAKYRKPSAFELKIVALNYAMLDDLVNADRWVTTALEGNPRDLQACIRLGEIKDLRLRFDEATDVFRKCLSLDPRNTFAVNGIGISYERLGRLHEAIAEFRKAIAWQPKNMTPDPTPIFNLGRVLLKESKPQEALPYLRNAADLLPEGAEAHEQLGKAYTILNELQLAQKELEKAVTLAPELPRLHYLLGQLYRREGLSEKARVELDRFTVLKATHPTAEPYPQ